MLRSKTSQIFALAAINLVGILVLLVVVELVLGNWLTPSVVPRNGIVNRNYVYRQDLYPPYGTITYTRDRFGLRGVLEPLSKVDLVTVGGSTTDQRYVGDGDTWQDVLRARSGLAVANAGIDGMSSYGHIVAVTEWLHRLPDFSPRFYLHYIGVNDAALSIGTTNGGPTLSDRAGNEAGLVRILRARSFIVTAIENLWFRAQGPRVVSHGALKPPPSHGSDEMVKVTVDTRDIDGYIAAHYGPNLRKLIDLSRSHGEGVIFVSQPAHPAFVRWQGPDTFVAAWYSSLGPWAVALRSINAATREVCEQAADSCRFVDLAHGVKFDPADFYDLVHTTASGAKKIGAFVAEQFAIMQRREDGGRHPD